MKSRADGALIAIDPGVSLGWAYWSRPTRLDYRPTASGVVSPRIGFASDDDWDLRCDSTIKQLAATIGPLDVPANADVVCEYPAFMESASRGRTSARRGDLVKLAVMCGRLREFFRFRFLDIVGPGHFHWAPVQRWKGTLPKSVVNARVRKVIGDEACRKLSKDESHDWDAVALGLWKLGVLNAD